MAKKSKDEIFQDFLADVLTTVPENYRESAKEIFGADSVKSKLRDSVLARSEFSAQMDALKAERETFGAEVAEARKRIDGWQKWYGDASKEVATMQDQLKQYKEEYGDLSPDAQRKVARDAGMTKEQFEQKLAEEIQRHDVAALKFADDLTNIKLDYRDRFKGEKLDTEAVFKLAGEKGVSLDVAYNLHIADRVADQQKADLAVQLKAAREEGAKEALAQHKLPVMSSTSDVTHVLDVKDAPKTERDRVAAAVAGFYASRK